MVLQWVSGPSQWRTKTWAPRWQSSGDPQARSEIATIIHLSLLTQFSFAHSFVDMLFASGLSLVALAATSSAQQCLLQFDGRVPVGSTPASFDVNTSPFGTQFVFGQSMFINISSPASAYINQRTADLAWSKIILLPNITGSLVRPPVSPSWQALS